MVNIYDQLQDIPRYLLSRPRSYVMLQRMRCTFSFKFPLLLFKDISTLHKFICIFFFSNACRFWGFYPKDDILQIILLCKIFLLLIPDYSCYSPFPPGIPLDIWDCYIREPGTGTLKTSEKLRISGDSEETIPKPASSQRGNKGNKHQLQNKEFYCHAVTEKKDTFEHEA